MRDIEFRGKSVDKGIWFYGYYFYSEKEDKHYIIGESKDYGFQKVEVTPETVGQYTGLKDKNGLKIYEGDIMTSANDVKGIIKYENGMFLLEFNTGFNRLNTYTGDGFKYFEVIGNVHEEAQDD